MIKSFFAKVFTVFNFNNNLNKAPQVMFSLSTKKFMQMLQIKRSNTKLKCQTLFNCSFHVFLIFSHFLFVFTNHYLIITACWIVKHVVRFFCFSFFTSFQFKKENLNLNKSLWFLNISETLLTLTLTGSNYRLLLLLFKAVLFVWCNPFSQFNKRKTFQSLANQIASVKYKSLVSVNNHRQSSGGPLLLFLFLFPL